MDVMGLRKAIKENKIKLLQQHERGEKREEDVKAWEKYNMQARLT